jgi:hypothetical protein
MATNRGGLESGEGSSSASRITQHPVSPLDDNDHSFPLLPMDGDRNNYDSDASAHLNTQSQERVTRGHFLGGVKPFHIPKSSKRRLTLQQSWWPFEIIAAVVSALAMTALIGVLYRYDGRVVQDLPFSLTLNGVVAILATVSRTALMIPVASGISQGKWSWFYPRGAILRGKKLEDLEMFDDASRGSWGSLKLLWRLKAR